MAKWFRLDLYRPGKKNIKTQSWYPNKQAAFRAKQAINTYGYGERVIEFEAGDVLITQTRKEGGLYAKGPIADNECNFIQP